MLGTDIEYLLQSNALSAKSVLGGRVALTVITRTGKGKTIIFALLGLVAELSESKGHYIIISPLKALENDQVCTKAS